MVGNPPYIRQERLANKAAMRRFASYHGVADLYVYFVELAHELLRAGGRYCLIVPNKWLTVAYGRGLRSYLAAQTSVDGVVDLARSALFAGADAFPCIVWGTRTAARVTPIQALRTAPGAEVAASLELALASIARGPEFADAAVPPRGAGLRATAATSKRAADAASVDVHTATPEPRATPQSAVVVRASWGAAPWHLDAPSERALLDRLGRAFPRLADVIPHRPARGIVSGCNRAFVIDGEVRARLLAEDPGSASLIRPFVKGRDVRPWSAAATTRWILLVDRGTDLERTPAIAAHLARHREALEPRPAGCAGAWPGRKPGSYAWFELQDPVGPLIGPRTPRLLYQDIQTAPACALDLEGALVPDTTVWMLPTADLLVAAVLNSAIYGWYARRRFPPALNGAVRPKQAYLCELPLPVLAAGPRAELERTARARLELATELAEGDHEPGLTVTLDATLATMLADAYALSTAERALIAAG